MSKKIAVIFPGIGYTCDKPLLYYSAKIAANLGYEIRPVPYGNFPAQVKGNREKMVRSFETALQQAEDMLQDVDWTMYREILFLSKSIGTIVAAAYGERHELKVRNVSFTPLEDTFRFVHGEGIMFHGTADPWVENSDVIRKACKKIGQTLYLTEQGNHSLETGDVEADISNLRVIMRQVSEFLQQNNQVRQQLRITGRVQGVGFRYRAEYAASLLGITGWVRNEPDDSVTMEVQGTIQQINEMMKMINKSPYIRMDWIDRKGLPVKTEETLFKVKY